MKTVCVVTWYKSNNFGTCLQAVALVKALEEMGYTNITIVEEQRFPDGSTKICLLLV